MTNENEEKWVSEIDVDVDRMAVKACCLEMWKERMLMLWFNNSWWQLQEEYNELVQQCWHLPPFWVVRGDIFALPSTWAVRGVALNGCLTSSCPNPIHQTSSDNSWPQTSHPSPKAFWCSLDRCPWVLRWSLFVSLSGEDLKMPATWHSRAWFVDCKRWTLSSNSRFLNQLFKTGATCDSFVLELIRPSNM